MEKEEIRDIILESMVASLEAQVRALKKLRGSLEPEEPATKSMSQLSIVLNILTRAGPDGRSMCLRSSQRPKRASV